ncbi:hypothetical protein KKD62_03605 [Patescibacteria group bacterium]|nr:hypothetical protein [Patescibacteria group bacterium]MBU1931786.1 hypothetical protein [Patescibacteria group bacterium]
MKLIRKSLLVLIVLFLSPLPVLAKVCSNADEVATGLGCISTNPQKLVIDFILTNAIKIAGGLAFLLFLGGGFALLTSAGDPEKINKGKEVITAAISGLLFIIFSVYLLRIIGYDILRIPDFTD